MAKIKSGSDAASITPKLIPDAELLGRDDSGGGDYQPYSAAFGDGKRPATGGNKSHLSAGGGSEDEIDGTEQVSTSKARTANPARKAR